MIMDLVLVRVGKSLTLAGEWTSGLLIWTWVNFVTKYIEDSNAVILLEMASSPSIFYRTSNDDIVDVDQCNAIIDDDDPWIRTTDCTCLGRLIDEAHQLNKKRFDDCVEIKKLVITPTRGYYMPFGLELSNRILREFGADSFIRVSFTDEGTTILNRRMLNFYTALKRMKAQLQRTSIYRRIENILNNGFTLGTEHFVFLALSRPPYPLSR
ncbi:hypothetical protein BC332_15866 [Capsicum chinense]|nr:hypothetical protein BC332_15866 [Capsicum chinense]